MDHLSTSITAVWPASPSLCGVSCGKREIHRVPTCNQVVRQIGSRSVLRLRPTYIAFRDRPSTPPRPFVVSVAVCVPKPWSVVLLAAPTAAADPPQGVTIVMIAPGDETNFPRTGGACHDARRAPGPLLTLCLYAQTLCRSTTWALSSTAQSSTLAGIGTCAPRRWPR